MTDSKAPLDGYEVLLCVTGGIACYKAADLTSKLVKAGAGVTVAMTDSATKFVAPLTFQTLSARQVYTSMWQATEAYEVGHLSPTERADLILVAPATANIMAKMACGLADEIVASMALSAHGECPILIAPAMNTRMWNAPATQANLKLLVERGVHTVGPGEGFLACRAQGMGRLVDVSEILAVATKILTAKPPKRR